MQRVDTGSQAMRRKMRQKQVRRGREQRRREGRGEKKKNLLKLVKKGEGKQMILIQKDTS